CVVPDVCERCCLWSPPPQANAESAYWICGAPGLPGGSRAQHRADVARRRRGSGAIRPRQRPDFRHPGDRRRAADPGSGDLRSPALAARCGEADSFRYIVYQRSFNMTETTKTPIVDILIRDLVEQY